MPGTDFVPSQLVLLKGLSPSIGAFDITPAFGFHLDADES